MKIEELEKLSGYCSQLMFNQAQEKSLSYKLSKQERYEVVYGLKELVDAEIDRLSVTDYKISEAIDFVINGLDELQQRLPVLINPIIIRTLLTALRQYRKPAPESEYDGLKVKYEVRKVRNGEIVNGCFVLRPDKDHAPDMDLRTYAEHTENKQLANDIYEWIGKPKPHISDADVEQAKVIWDGEIDNSRAKCSACGNPLTYMDYFGNFYRHDFEYCGECGRKLEDEK